jgi:hypothetical protein
MIDANATLFAGVVLLAVVLGLWLYEIARGRDGDPYGLLAAITGLAYIAGVAWGRFRS